MLTADRVVTAGQDLRPAWLRVTDGRVAALGQGSIPVAADEHLDGVVVPGFVDVHCHGALGSDFASADAHGVRAAAEFHARAGSTSVVASVATAPLEVMERQVGRLGTLVRSRVVAGVHLEGRFLSPLRRGAHDERLLAPPSPDDLERLLAAGPVAMVTLAPELPGGLEAVRRLADLGVVAALGHSDADAGSASAAVDAGARAVTHLFNGMGPFSHRAPALPGVALTDERLTLELVVDGEHLDPLAVTLALRAAGDRVVLVSDAMSATGQADGRYDLAGQAVDVVDGVPRVVADGSLAGSTTPVAGGLRRLVVESGVPLQEALAAVTSRPAELLGLEGVGDLRPGSYADLVVLDPDAVTVRRVMRGGEWL
nr:amidohydrolase family protein [Motilibacter aurantiacus]